MKIDTHIHSTISCDGKDSIEAMCRSAIDRGLDAVCFTEHFDMNPKDYGYQFFDYELYTRQIDQAREMYEGRLIILKGLEFSEPHLYPRELEKMNRLGFDYILGSVHWIGSSWIGDQSYQKAHTTEELFLAHYQETLKACQNGMFDSLAHIDFPKRYLQCTYEPVSLIQEILSLLISKDICLEVNTSPLRKAYTEYYPSQNILKWYITTGGKHITIGSDAHSIEDIAADFDKIQIDLMQPCYFKHRQKILL